MQGLNLYPIRNNEIFSWYDGQNYTYTSFIDGFYIPLHTLPKCQTLTNQIQNSNHYSDNFILNSVKLAQKSHQSPKYQPKFCLSNSQKTYKHSLRSKKPPI